MWGISLLVVPWFFLGLGFLFFWVVIMITYTSFGLSHCVNEWIFQRALKLLFFAEAHHSHLSLKFDLESSYQSLVTMVYIRL